MKTPSRRKPADALAEASSRRKPTDPLADRWPIFRELLQRWEKRGRRWETRPYYPAILDIAGRRALVIGAGSVGEGKIEGLLRGAAEVHVVSLSATDRVKEWAAAGRIELELRAFREEDLDGCFMVIAATEDNETNVRVFEGAEARRMLCNVVDVTHLCNFILPSIVRHGDLAIAVSTGGASPAMARRIRIAIGQCYGDEYEIALQVLGSLREELKQRHPAPDDRKVLFERMVYTNFMDLVRAGDDEGLEAWIERCIAEGPRYASPEEHAAMLRAASPECKLRFAPMQIDQAPVANGR